MFPIPIAGFDYSKDDKGNWIYKANPVNKLLPKIKPKDKEKPQFKIQNEIEKRSLNNFYRLTNKMVIEITHFLKDNLH